MMRWDRDRAHRRAHQEPNDRAPLRALVREQTRGHLHSKQGDGEADPVADGLGGCEAGSGEVGLFCDMVGVGKGELLDDLAGYERGGDLEGR